MKTNVETGLKKPKSYFSSNLKWFRENEKLTQQQLADKLNLKRAAIGAYEEGRANPRMESLIIMADYFGIKIDELVRIPNAKKSIREFNPVN